MRNEFMMSLSLWWVSEGYLVLTHWPLSIFKSTIFTLIITLRPGQDGCHFADDIFTCIFINENCCILIKFSLKYVRKNPVDNNPALVQIMAWRRSGDKPLSEPMMVRLPTHICVTRPQWVKQGTHCEIAAGWMPQNLTDEKSTLVQVMAWCCQAASHYLNQCWPRSVSPYGITRPPGSGCCCRINLSSVELQDG